MLRISTKSQKNLKNKLLTQKTKFRNSKGSFLPKASTSLKPTLKEKVDLVGQRTSTFVYNMKKRQKLNTLKEQTNKVSVYMNKLGNSFKAFNNSLNSGSNQLMVSNLTNINFKRSLYIRNQLRNIDRMNRDFDREYNPMNLNQEGNYKYSNYDLKQIDEVYEEKINREKKIREKNFRTESTKIFNLLFKKNSEDEVLSDYKRNKKLNELKSNIDYVCGVDDKSQSKNKQNDPNKIPHYTIPIKSPSFIREKSKNVSFTPSVKYNKSKVYFCKKYELSQDKICKSKYLFEKLDSTIQISPKKKIDYKIKPKNIIIKTEENNNNNYIISPIKKAYNKEKEISKAENLLYKDNNSINSYKTINSANNNDNLPEIKTKEYRDTIIKTLPNRNTILTFSPKLRNHPYKQNLILPKKQNFSTKDLNINNRCQTANNITHIKNNNIYTSTITDSNSNTNININGSLSSKKNKKKFFPILKTLLDDNYNLKKDLKLGFNIITNMINDFKKNPKKKIPKHELNIEKLRKDLKLYNTNNVIDEIDVVMNNVKKMEKLVKKKDIFFLRKVAKTVLREDKLANKNLVFDNNNINAKLKKIYERRNKVKNEDEMEGVNLDRQEKIEMIKLFKNDGPDFFNEEYLSNLIKRYKTMKIK